MDGRVPSSRRHSESYLVFLILSMVTVGVGFVLHELAHKFTAMNFGYWAEFRKDNLMLLVAVVLAALVGVVFAAPGATMIYGSGVTREQNGKISAAGPVTNLILCIPFAFLLFISNVMDPASSSRSILVIAGMVGLQVNAMIAAFNMLPVSVLDGRKVLAWNPAIFADPDYCGIRGADCHVLFRHLLNRMNYHFLPGKVRAVQQAIYIIQINLF